MKGQADLDQHSIGCAVRNMEQSADGTAHAMDDQVTEAFVNAIPASRACDGHLSPCSPHSCHQVIAGGKVCNDALDSLGKCEGIGQGL